MNQYDEPRSAEPTPEQDVGAEPPPEQDAGAEPAPDPDPWGPEEQTRPLWDTQVQAPWHDPYGYPYPGQAPYPASYQAAPRPSLPGWVWPLVAVTALVVGLVGGTLGGVAVSTSMDDPADTVFDSDSAVPAPLPMDNRSVAAVADQLLPSTVQVLARGAGDGRGATGSGFVLDRRGHVITNNHVVSDSTGDSEIQVVDHEGRPHAANIVGRSAVYDIAVLKIRGAEDLRPAALGSTKSMQVGETVVAIGSPLGLSSTVTSGIISALDRPVTTGAEDDASYINAVQTDAAINPGNSGGPLVNLRGEVVGVNSAIATMGSFAGDSGNIGVGFAIPMEQVRVTAAQILETGQAQYPVIGANVNTGSVRNAAKIVKVPAGTPAAQAGLEVGDLVVAVEGTPVTDGIGLIVAIRSHQPGETIALRVRRDGQELTVRVELEAKTG